jgi:hypothetical protein
MGEMNAALEIRGADRILAHCAAIGAAEVTYEQRDPAFDRLEALVGRELARLLVFALAGAQSRRS